MVYFKTKTYGIYKLSIVIPFFTIGKQFSDIITVTVCWYNYKEKARFFSHFSECEKIIANETTDKGLISKTYKQLIQLTEKAMATHSSTLAWKIPWTEEPDRLQSMGSLSWTQLSDFTFILHFHALEKEMATHSSVLAWRIPGTEEPSGLPSMGSRRVRHDWSDLAAAAAYNSIPEKQTTQSKSGGKT